MEPHLTDPSTEDTHNIMDNSEVSTVLPFTSILEQHLNSGHPANGQFSWVPQTILNDPDLADTRHPFQQDCPPLLLELTT